MSLSAGVVIAGVTHLVEKEALKVAAKHFKEKVVEKWSEYRANAFLVAFIDEVRKEKDVRYQSADLNDLLQLVSRSDKQTTALFDAYRRVALSTSKKIGPMVIGMLTACIVIEDREPTPDEELIFYAAESLNDREFVDLKDWLAHVYEENPDARGQSLTGAFQALSVVAKTGPLQAPGASMQAIALRLDEAPFDIAEEVGIFALKLRNWGLLTERVRPRENVSEEGFTRYLVIVSAACQRLNALSVRAIDAVSAKASSSVAT